MFFVKMYSAVLLLGFLFAPVASAVEMNEINEHVVVGVKNTPDGGSLYMISILNNEKTHTLLLTCSMPTAEVIVVLLAVAAPSYYPQTQTVTTTVSIDGEHTLNFVWVNSMVKYLLHKYSSASLHSDGFVKGLMHSNDINIALPRKLLYFDFSVANPHIVNTLKKCTAK